MNIIGVDFSINKPAICIYAKGNYYFFAWPWGLKESHKKIFQKNGVNIIDRIDDKNKGNNISSKMRYEVSNSLYLSNLIVNTIKEYLNSKTFISFEGQSYGSKGDVVLQLGGYKYLLMSKLNSYISFEKMYTYSPQTLKMIAGCSKKGKTKQDMIEAFIGTNIKSKFREALKNNKELFLNKKGINYIPVVDDLIDSYWALETFREKEGFN